jgi:phosphatidylethanolamine-binding protein (PEBP) family uncharacterized protein
MAVDVEWLREHECSAKSPAMAVTGIPSGATRLIANMVDNDMPSYAHGGGAVDTGNVINFNIEPGSMKDYKGPCPPNFGSFGHDYNWTVKAVDSSGRVLATAVQTKTFSASKVPK